MAAESYRIGEKLRSVRERRSLTLREVAGRAGVSESLVSQVERGRVTPALETLLSLCEALDVDPAFLFSGLGKRKAVRIVHAAERSRFEQDGVRYERLSQAESADGRYALEAFLLELPQGCERGSRDYGHPGQELGLVMEGEGVLVVGGEDHPLTAGDSLAFAAHTPHVLRNTGSGMLRAFWVVTPPKGFVAAGNE
jgi:transcriptional regulator with XRE-family HTH domain